MPCNDITSGAGNMLVVNGSGTPNSNVWCQTIAVDQNTDYVFSAWITNALNDPTVANLQFFVNGVQIGNVFSTSTVGCNWAQFNDIWPSGTNSSANICIVNQNTNTGGNDFAIDDIFFAPICALSDTIVISVDQISVDAGPDLSFCANAPEMLVASTNDPNASISWNNGQTALSFEPQTSGMYVITATSVNGCVAEDSAAVTVIPMDWAIDDVNATTADCGIDNGQVSATTTGVFAYPAVYEWTGPGTSGNTYSGTTWNNLGPGWYYIAVSSGGCFKYDSVEVLQNEPPQALGSASPESGQTPLSVNFNNFSMGAGSYQWNFGNDSLLTTSNQDQITIIYDSAGVYTVMLVAIEAGCSDTIYFTITVVDPPEVIPFSVNVPNVFTPNGDGENDFYLFEMTNVEEFEIEIVNRWGVPVASGKDINFFWDGTSHGIPASEGTYFYTYRLVNVMGEEQTGHGFLQLVR
jgi:gliding motility-associated-like protein